MQANCSALLQQSSVFNGVVLAEDVRNRDPVFRVCLREIHAEVPAPARPAADVTEVGPVLVDRDSTVGARHLAQDA